jgi:hypothetical protein
MKLLQLLIFCLVISLSTTAQKNAIKGSVTDTLNKQNLQKATISLLRSKDSVLIQFTRSTQNGDFVLENNFIGKFIILVTYPTYADYYDTVSLQANGVVDLGLVKLTTKAHLLSDVTVVQKIAAVRMKGDTLVYKADSFKVKEGASVEELLKKFPGIQVDKSGNITAQGTKVEKVLVDGEEFFGDDPTIATKNLSASMVNEVQVFDKKSDQATFTGIDDGSTTRTINLKLKDDAKKGWFGKAELASNGNERWNNSLMANSFKKKRKFSVYGITSSTGKTGLDWTERGQFGESENNNMTITDDGGMYMSWGGGDGFDNPNYWGEGIPKSWSAGINYSNKFKKDQQSLNGSYKYGKIINEGFGSTLSQSILPDTLFFNNDRRTIFGNKDRHSLNGSFDWLVDSFFSVKTTITASKGTQVGSSIFYSESLNAFNQFVNKSNRINNSNADNQSFKATILFRKKFKKNGRTLSLNIEQSMNQSDGTSFLYAVNDFYNKSGVINVSDTTDQQKLNNSTNNILMGKLAFTEQLMKDLTLELSYGLKNNQSKNKLLSYDKNIDGNYSLLNNQFSNDFDFRILTNQVGSMIRLNKKKITFSAGGDITFANFKQQDLIKDTLYTYQFTNFFPKANFTYKFNANKRINFNYNGNTRQPTIQELQPLANNNNPLFIQVGNPNLKQEFNHRLNISFNNYQVLKNRGFNIGANGSFIDNAIRNSMVTDSTGKTISQSVNANGNYNYSAYIGFNTKLPKLDMYFYTNYSYNFSNNVSIVNTLKNETGNDRHSISFNLSKDVEEKYNFWMYTSFNYNISSSSIRPENNTQFWTINGGAELNIQLPWKLELNNNIDVELRQKTPLFSGNNNVTIWNAYIAKKILKNDKSQLRLSAFDILNQNRGYSRNISSTMLTENNFNQLAQYFTLSFIWNFSKGAVTN